MLWSFSVSLNIDVTNFIVVALALWAANMRQ
jgi:hypothetical protein